MAHSTKKGHGNAWRHKETDEEYDKIETPDGTKYILYVPNFNQRDAYQKSLKKYKDVFDKIKAGVNEGDAAIGNGLPDLHPVAWAALLSSTLKELNKTWGVNDKIWIYNKLHDRDREHIAMYVAITPKITQRNAKRTARKVSPATEEAASSTTTKDDAGYSIHQDDIEYGPMIDPITRTFLGLAYFKTKNGLTYYYHTKEDAHNNKHFKVEEEDKEINTCVCMCVRLF